MAYKDVICSNDNCCCGLAPFVNAKYENTNLGWPGLVFRKSGNRLELTQSINMGQKVQKYTGSNIELPYRVKIIRIAQIIEVNIKN